MGNINMICTATVSVFYITYNVCTVRTMSCARAEHKLQNRVHVHTYTYVSDILLLICMFHLDHGTAKLVRPCCSGCNGPVSQKLTCQVLSRPFIL